MVSILSDMPLLECSKSRHQRYLAKLRAMYRSVQKTVEPGCDTIQLIIQQGNVIFQFPCLNLDPVYITQARTAGRTLH